MQLPRKFLELHSDALFKLFQQHGEVVRIVPREPLGAVEPELLAGPADEYVTVVTIRCINKHGVVYFEAASKADAIVAAAWAEKHRDTTREEFDWLP